MGQNWAERVHGALEPGLQLVVVKSRGDRASLLPREEEGRREAV